MFQLTPTVSPLLHRLIVAEVVLAVCVAPVHAQSDDVVLTAARSGGSVSLSWTGGVAPFDVYRSTSPAGVFSPSSRIVQTSNASWLDTPPVGTLICYGVKSASDSDRIAIVRSQPDGPVLMPLLGSVVTYTKAAIGSDPAGFFIQNDALGPALFVALDPGTLSPVPVAGDRISFTITAMGTLNGLREAVALSGYARASTGNPIVAAQDVSTASDLISNLSAYESERISITGVVAQALQPAGAGFVSAPIVTTGIPAVDPNLQFRAATAVADAYDLVQNCMIQLSGTPLWRFNPVAQPTALSATELVAVSCPAPRVTSALALSATSVRVNFDRHIDPSSVDPSGSQFALSAGLTASAATVSGKQVTLTTSSQSAGATYNVTVSSSVTDTVSSGIDPGANSATFSGFAAPAVLLINEVSPAISSSKDLVEILVVIGGSTAGVTLEQSVSAPTVLATLPAISVASGDIIVVHLNPGAGEGPVSETLSKTQYPASTYGNNYDAAWDVNGGTTGITFNDRVLLLRRSTGVIADAIPFVSVGGASPAAFLGDLATIQAGGEWLPPDCGGVACTDATTPTAEGISVSWTGVGTTPSGFSVQRKPIGDTNLQSDWKAASASSFGAPNSP